MERFAIKKMLAWKQSSRRKPLILKGVRQVGKTWILKEFGKRYYKNVAYFNFDENEEFKQFFRNNQGCESYPPKLNVGFWSADSSRRNIGNFR